MTNAAALSSGIPSGSSYVVSFAVSWEAPDGTSPSAISAITMTITDPSIVAGDVIYEVTSTGLQAVGTATVDGSVTITFTNDPTFVVSSAPRPKSPVPTVTSKVVIDSKSLAVTGKSLAVPVKLTCSVAPCSGSIQLTETVTSKQSLHVKSGKKTVTKTVTKATTVVLASASFAAWREKERHRRSSSDRGRTARPRARGGLAGSRGAEHHGQGWDESDDQCRGAVIEPHADERADESSFRLSL